VRQHMVQLRQTPEHAFALAVGALTDTPSFSILFDLWMFHFDVYHRFVFDPYINFNIFLHMYAHCLPPVHQHRQVHCNQLYAQ
jgi:hypothetical protein